MPQLTKEEIQFIDNYLIKNGVKYWDVRIELLDHIVSAVEETINTHGISFNEALLEVHKSFGNKLGNFKIDKNFRKALYYSNKGFKKFQLQKQKEIARKYRKSYWKDLLYLLKQPRFLIEYFTLVIVVFSVYQFNMKYAAITAIVIAVLPEIYKLKYLFDKSVRYSLHLNLSGTLTALFLSNQYFIILGFDNYIVTNSFSKYSFFAVFYMIVFLFMRAGLYQYQKAYKICKAHYQLYKS